MKNRNFTWERKVSPQHKRISLFALIQCWLKDVDGIGFTRDDLARLLPSGRLEHSRVDLLVEDMSEFFPYSHRLWPDSQLVALFVSRRPIDKTVFKSQKTIPKPDILKQNKLVMISLWNKEASEKLSTLLGTAVVGEGSRDRDQRIVARYLTRLAQGRIPARKISQMKRAEPPLVFKR
jgi:hypothetical protein